MRLVQGSHESSSWQEPPRLGSRGHRAADGAHDFVVDLVVLPLAQARRQADLEDEELARQRRRVEVVRQPGAVAHGEAPQFRAAAKQARDTPFQLRFDGVHSYKPPTANILAPWSTATTFC